MTELELLDGDFASSSPQRKAQEKLAKRLAQAAGWDLVGSRFENLLTGASYYARDMDGWTDLCGNEGITPPDTRQERGATASAPASPDASAPARSPRG
jgi:hypothetical protein